MIAKTRGEIEAGIGTAVVQIQRRATGRGPRCSMAHLSGAQLVVRMLGGLTQAEELLLKYSCGQEHCRETEVVRELRRALFEACRNQLEQVVREVTGTQAATIKYQLLSQTGEEEIIIELADLPLTRSKTI